MSISYSTNLKPVLKAYLTASDTIQIYEPIIKTVVSRTPVLDLCRSLIAEGFGNEAALEVFRGGMKCMIVADIQEAALLTVKETAYGPKFKKLAEMCFDQAQ